MPEQLYCEVCDRDASDQVIIARWHDCDVCTDCLADHEEMMREEQDQCECLDCLRHQHQHA